MAGGDTYKIGIELKKRIQERFGLSYVVCIDHREGQDDDCVAVGEIATGNRSYIQISHVDIAVLKPYRNNDNGYDGETVVLCEIEERCKGNVKQICGDILSMCVLDQIRVVAKVSEVDKVYSVGHQKVIMAYYSDGGNSLIDSSRWKPLEGAIMKRIETEDQRIMIVRSKCTNLKEDLIDSVIDYLNKI